MGLAGQKHAQIAGGQLYIDLALSRAGLVVFSFLISFKSHFTGRQSDFFHTGSQHLHIHIGTVGLENIAFGLGAILHYIAEDVLCYKVLAVGKRRGIAAIQKGHASL